MKKLKLLMFSLITIIVFSIFIMPAKAISNSKYLPALATRSTGCSQYEVVMVSNTRVIKYISCESTFALAKAKANAQVSTSTNVASVIKDRKIIYTKYGVVDYYIDNSTNVYFYTSSSVGTLYTYINATVGGSDAAFLDYNDGNGAVQIKISDYTGWIKSGNYVIVPMSIAINRSYYEVIVNSSTGNKEIRHRVVAPDNEDGEQNITTTGSAHYTIGPLGQAPSYLQTGIKYYSYDGRYFYTDFMKLIDDYRARKVTNSVNGANPHYNYYQYLPHRSKTVYDATTLNTYLTNKLNSLGYYNSKLYNTGASFIDAQNKYGANALLMLGVAANESGWGKSDLAIYKNNLFGHNATDINPYGNGTAYTTIANGINYHGDYFINRQYLDVVGDSRYYGPHLGTKGSGVNAKYASDPYWGEKAAAIAYQIDNANGLQDYKNPKALVIKTGGGSVAVKKEASATSATLYNLNNKNLSVAQIPQIKLATQNGYYKIQTDMGLSSTRSVIAPSSKINNSSAYLYNWNYSYAYVPTSSMYAIQRTITKPGMFYLHDLSWDNTNKKFNITGYGAVTGMHNVLANPADYQLIITNQYDSTKKYTFNLNRITSTANQPFKIGTIGGYDYSGAWFSGSFDVSDIPQGDYKINLLAQINGVEANMVVNNAMFRPMSRKMTDVSGRGLMLKINFPRKDIPIEMFIRDAGLISNSSLPTSDNMFNDYTNIYFNNGNLRIRGTSFNIGVDYSKLVNVERKIIFENLSNFTRTEFLSNYIDNGDYKIALKVADGKDKTRAWFDSTLDLTTLPIGKYAIIMKTKAGLIDDNGELTDTTMRSLPTTHTYGGRQYILTINQNARWRIELEIK